MLESEEAVVMYFESATEESSPGRNVSQRELCRVQNALPRRHGGKDLNCSFLDKSCQVFV